VNVDTNLWDNEDIETEHNKVLENMDLSKAPSEPFTDSTFPAEKKSLTGPMEDDKKLGTKVKYWKRVKDIVSKPRLFIDGSEEGDVCQGGLGDCWFIGAMSVVATKPLLMKHVFYDDSVDGTICCRFFKDGKWNHVVVDDLLPVRYGSSLTFARCKNPRELWVPLCEKAYAKLHGSYRALSGGHTEEGLGDLTGGVAWRINVNPDDVKSDTLWKQLLKCNEDDWVMGAGIFVSGAKQESALGDTGLLSGHAYGLMKAVEVNGTRLVQLRNPWGSTEWKKSWSDKSKKWKDVSSEDKARIGYKVGNDGSFFMSYEDFCKYWSLLRICRVFFKDKYLKQTFDGEFKKGETSGRYLKELPQYYLKVSGEKKTQEVVISCYQSDKRVISNNKKEAVLVGLLVYHCSGKKTITGGKKFCSASSTYSRECIIKKQFPPGEYMIIPYVYTAGKETPFWIRVFSDDLIELDKVRPSPKGETYENYCKMNKEAIEYFKNKDNEEFKKKQVTKKVEKKVKDVKNPDTIAWVDKAKDGIKVTNNDLTCSNVLKTSGARTSYSNFTFTEKRNYFEVKVDKTTKPSNIMIGVVDKDEHTNQKSFINLGKRSFAYYGYTGKTYNNGVSKDYGAKIKEGDLVGISVDFDKKEIEFYLNGQSQGVAYSTAYISGCLTPAVTLHARDDQVTLNPDAKEPEPETPKKVGVFEDGARIHLKNALGGFWQLSSSQKFVSVDSPQKKFNHYCFRKRWTL